MVKVISSDSEFATQYKAVPSNRLVVLYFTASWCGPCQRIAPVVDDLAQKYPNASILKVDVDAAQNTAQSYRIQSMPTFVFLRNSSELERFSGADPTRLQKTIEKYYTKEFAVGSGQVLGSGSGTGRSVLLDRYAAPAGNPNPTPTPAPAPASVPAPAREQSPPAPTTVSSPAPSSTAADEAQPSISLQDILPTKRFIKCTKTGKLFNSTAEATKYAKDTGNTEFDEVTEQYNPLGKEHNSKVAELLDMGFLEKRIQRAIVRTNDGNIEACIEWLYEHSQDEDIDQEIDASELVKFFEEKKEKPKLSFDEQQRLLKEKIEKARIAKAEEEAKREREREIMRRKQGQEATEAVKNLEYEKLKKEAELKKKEKEEERLAKERVRKQIEEDRLERQRRHGGGAAAAAAPAAAPVTTSATPAAQPTAPAKTYTSCTVQVRMFDGSTVRFTYDPMDTLVKLYNDIAQKTQVYEFRICTTFPRKVYSGEMLASTTFKEAELVPNGTVTLTR